MPRVRSLGTNRKGENITKLFKKSLIEKEWTTKHLAELCGKDTSEVSRIINHPLRVRFETILLLADKLGIESLPI